MIAEAIILGCLPYPTNTMHTGFTSNMVGYVNVCFPLRNRKTNAAEQKSSSFFAPPLVVHFEKMDNDCSEKLAAQADDFGEQ